MDCRPLNLLALNRNTYIHNVVFVVGRVEIKLAKNNSFISVGVDGDFN